MGESSPFYMVSKAKCKRTRERRVEHSPLALASPFACHSRVTSRGNRELAYGLSLRLRVRLSRCHVELHHGTVLGALSQLLLSITVLRRRLGRELLSPKTAPWCNSTQHRPSPTRSLTCPPARTRIIWCYGREEILNETAIFLVLIGNPFRYGPFFYTETYN